ncbi:ABC transporter permease [Microbacterium sp. KR10-403]|uniref:ABC transporter permease n=1 Tax=Microbacterium sp. KR10-403 TaxID=3158581 RepID=UPI0032E36F82
MTETERIVAVRGSGQARKAGWFRRLSGSARVSVIAIVVIAVAAATAKLWWPESSDQTNAAAALMTPSLSHPMGTDGLGRDVFARVLEGAGISLAAGLIIAVAAVAVGGALAIIAGLRPGAIDLVIMRITDSLLAFPALILAIAVAAGLGSGFFSACVAIVVSTFPLVTRVVRSDVLRIRGGGHIQAARALGVTPSRIVWRHVLPHVSSALLVQFALVVAFGIIALAGLGFIGLGIQLPTPELGAMILDGAAPLIGGAWWISIFPGLMLLAIVASVNVIADSLRVILDQPDELTGAEL